MVTMGTYRERFWSWRSETEVKEDGVRTVIEVNFNTRTGRDGNFERVRGDVEDK